MCQKNIKKKILTSKILKNRKHLLNIIKIYVVIRCIKNNFMRINIGITKYV